MLQTQTTGNVFIYSDPPVSTIYIDGRLISGTTPLIITGLPPGSHTYRLVLSGYKEESGIFLVEPWSTTYIYQYLEPIPTVSVRTEFIIPIIIIVVGAYLTKKFSQ